ncbi:MAG: serine/threonine-protein phosphatase [Kiritimatiellae bacterium]|nr:serine/threonine-protein phosphatase [Kiritimatiellia bacterium]
MAVPFKHLRHAALSDVGKVRAQNEDAFGTFPEYGVFCVADGMGGGRDGALASSTIVRFIGNFLNSYPAPHDTAYAIDEMLDGVRQTVNEASDWIFRRTKAQGGGMCGSTFVGLCFNGGFPQSAFALHAGDSRLYRFRRGALEQLTLDHSLAVAVGLDENRLTKGMRSVVMRAVGVEQKVSLDTTTIDVEEGDRFLLCSDGLTRMVDDEGIATILAKNDDVEAVAAALVAETNMRGGADNVTVLLVDVGSLPSPCDQVSMVSVVSDGSSGNLDEQMKTILA